MSATTNEGATAPFYDEVGGRLLASPLDLGTMAAIARGDVPGPDRQRLERLTAAGICGVDGEVVEDLRPVAVAAATARAVLRVSRRWGDSVRQVQVRAGNDGVLMAPAGEADEVGDVVLTRPDALARTLWRLGHLGPRDDVARQRLAVPGEELLAGMSGHAPWRERLDVDDVILTRFEVRTHPDESPTVLSVCDTPRGCWLVEGVTDGDGVELVPTRPRDILGELAAWQRAIVGPDGAPATATSTDEREVDLGNLRLTVPVPGRWEDLESSPTVPLACRLVGSEGFAPNLVVVHPEPDGEDPGGLDPRRDAGELASGLEGGRVVDAWLHEELGTMAVVVHAGVDEDVVAVQRRLPARFDGVSITATCAVGQWPSWAAPLTQLVVAAEPAPAPS